MSEIVDPMNTIAQSSRVRLARNYADIPFPQRMRAGILCRMLICAAKEEEQHDVR